MVKATGTRIGPKVVERSAEEELPHFRPNTQPDTAINLPYSISSTDLTAM
jgi:hypothetical protein